MKIDVKFGMNNVDTESFYVANTYLSYCTETDVVDCAAPIAIQLGSIEGIRVSGYIHATMRDATELSSGVIRYGYLLIIPVNENLTLILSLRNLSLYYIGAEGLLIDFCHGVQHCYEYKKSLKMSYVALKVNDTALCYSATLAALSYWMLAHVSDYVTVKVSSTDDVEYTLTVIKHNSDAIWDTFDNGDVVAIVPEVNGVNIISYSKYLCTCQHVAIHEAITDYSEIASYVMRQGAETVKEAIHEICRLLECTGNADTIQTLVNIIGKGQKGEK